MGYLRLLRVYFQAYGRKVVQSFPVFLMVFLLSLIVWFTIRTTEGYLGHLVFNTGVNVAQEEPSLMLDTKSNAIQAEFKGINNNLDGSIDLIFRVRRKAKVKDASSPTSRPSQSDTKSTENESPYEPERNETNLRAQGSRTTYPLTLSSAFLINTLTVCPRDKPVDYIIIVHSATAYFKRRQEIRETYGGRGVFGNVTQRVVFMLGSTTDTVTTRLIQQEALQHGDVVQGRFQDSYYNLTHKAVMGFRWVKDHCPQANLIVKIDDDVFVNTFKLVDEILPTYAMRKSHIACHLRKVGTSRIQRGKSRWKVTEDEFKGHETYPFNHCNGYFVILTADLVQPLLRAAWINPFFWIDDVYVFGVLPATVGNVTFVDIRKSLTLRFDVGQPCFEKRGFSCHLLAVSQYRQGGMENLWYTLLSNMTSVSMAKFKLFQDS
ncbi:hexosyltransferase [Elysia marginata]|uniref:Hexosyltransferase n=1 Tax=Elysia marginata TaxID=1093978 RepID=A0AAV4I4Z3_9GAST|nr:hexosyltransferase [Elysia marginata]